MSSAQEGKPMLKRTNALILFTAVESILYIAFLLLDLFNAETSLIKYLSICVCFFYALLMKIYNKNMNPVLLSAMTFTLFADTFLLLIGKYYLIGVISFCIVQTIYAVYLISISNILSIFPRLAAFLTLIIFLSLHNIADALSIASAYSYTQLIFNTIHAFTIKYKKSDGWLLAVGLLLFLMCDTCVGLTNITLYYNNMHTLISFIQPVASFGMWLFYLPAQVLIVCSFYNKYRRINNEK